MKSDCKGTVEIAGYSGIMVGDQGNVIETSLFRKGKSVSRYGPPAVCADPAPGDEKSIFS